METRYPEVAGFFNSDIKTFVLPDLKRLREEVRPDGGKAGCTIPTAMMAFALLDLLGFLMRDGPITAPEVQNGRANIGYALSRGAGLFPPEYEKNTALLIELFRHGLVHQVFPRSAAISKASPACWLITITPDTRLPVLNVDRLTDDLMTALEKLEERLRSKAGDVVASRMNAKILFLHKESAKALKKCDRKAIVRRCETEKPTQIVEEKTPTQP